MKKVVFLAMLLAAIVPSVSCLSAQKAEYGKVGKVKPSPLAMRRIEIDADKMKFQGNGTWWLRQNLAAMLRNRIKNTGQVEIAVSGRAFRDIAETQDRIHYSGRYSKTSREQTPIGEMVASTDQYRVTGIATIHREHQSVSLPFLGRQNRLSGGYTEIVATVRLIIEPVVIHTGLSDDGYETIGEASKKANLNVSGSLSRKHGSYRSSNDNIDADLLEEAASQAVDKFIAQFNPTPLEVAQK